MTIRLPQLYDHLKVKNVSNISIGMGYCDDYSRKDGYIAFDCETPKHRDELVAELSDFLPKKYPNWKNIIEECIHLHSERLNRIILQFPAGSSGWSEAGQITISDE